MLPARPFGVLSLEMRGGISRLTQGPPRAGVDGMSVSCDELRRLGVAQVGRVLSDAGLAASSVLAIGPAVESGGSGSIDDELEILDAAALLAAPVVMALTGPHGDLPARRGGCEVCASSSDSLHVRSTSGWCSCWSRCFL